MPNIYPLWCLLATVLISSAHAVCEHGPQQFINASAVTSFNISGNQYQPGVYCAVTVGLPAGFVHLLEIDFTLRFASSDHFIIYDGNIGDPILADLYEPRDQDTMTFTARLYTTQRNVTIVIALDNSSAIPALPQPSSGSYYYQVEGYHVAVKSTPTPAPVGLHCNSMNITVMGSGYASEPLPNYFATYGYNLYPYRGNATCGWRFITNTASNVMLLTVNIDVCPGDVVEIFDGAGPDAPRVNGSLYQKSSRTYQVYSTGNMLYVRFTTIPGPKYPFKGLEMISSEFVPLRVAPFTHVTIPTTSAVSFGTSDYSAHRSSLLQAGGTYDFLLNATAPLARFIAVYLYNYQSSMGPLDTIKVFAGSTSSAPLVAFFQHRVNDLGPSTTVVVDGTSALVRYEVSNYSAPVYWGILGQSTALASSPACTEVLHSTPPCENCPCAQLYVPCGTPCYDQTPGACTIIFDQRPGTRTIVQTLEIDLAPGDYVTMFEMTPTANVSIGTILSTDHANKAWKTTGTNAMMAIFTRLGGGVGQCYGGVGFCQAAIPAGVCDPVQYVTATTTQYSINPVNLNGGAYGYNSQFCLVNISTDPGLRISIQVSYCANIAATDTVTVYDGATTSAPVMFSVSGAHRSACDRAFPTTGSYAIVAFNATVPTTQPETGPIVFYRSTPITLQTPCNGVHNVTAANYLTNEGPAAALYRSSSSYEDYSPPPMSDCTWLYNADPNQPELLYSITLYAYGGFGTTLSIYNGSSTSGLRLARCVDNVCDYASLVALSAQTLIHFETRYPPQFSPGFVMRFVPTDTPVYCSGLQTIQAGTTNTLLGFGTAGTSRLYQYIPGLDCSYVITAGNDVGLKKQLNLRIQTPAAATPEFTLKIYHGVDNSAPLLASYSPAGYSGPGGGLLASDAWTITSPNEVFIEFHTLLNVTARSTVLTITYYESLIPPYRSGLYEIDVRKGWVLHEMVEYGDWPDIIPANFSAQFRFRSPPGTAIQFATGLGYSFSSSGSNAPVGSIGMVFDGFDENSPILLGNLFTDEQAILSSGNVIYVVIYCPTRAVGELTALNVRYVTLGRPAFDTCYGQHERVIAIGQAISSSSEYDSLMRSAYPGGMNCSFYVTVPYGQMLTLGGYLSSQPGDNLTIYDAASMRVVDRLSGAFTFGSYFFCRDVIFTFDAAPVNRAAWARGFKVFLSSTTMGGSNNYEYYCRPYQTGRICAGGTVLSNAVNITVYSSCAMFAGDLMIDTGSKVDQVVLPNLFLITRALKFGTTFEGGVKLAALQVTGSVCMNTGFGSMYKNVDMPSLLTVASFILGGSSTSFTAFILPNVFYIAYFTFGSSTVQSIQLPALRRIVSFSVMNCPVLKDLRFGNATILTTGPVYLQTVPQLTSFDGTIIYPYDARTQTALWFTQTGLVSINFPNFVRSTSASIITNNVNLQSVYLPNLSTSYILTISGNTLLQTIELPSLTTTSGDLAFV